MKWCEGVIPARVRVVRELYIWLLRHVPVCNCSVCDSLMVCHHPVRHETGAAASDLPLYSAAVVNPAVVDDMVVQPCVYKQSFRWSG